MFSSAAHHDSTAGIIKKGQASTRTSELPQKDGIVADITTRLLFVMEVVEIITLLIHDHIAIGDYQFNKFPECISSAKVPQNGQSLEEIFIVNDLPEETKKLLHRDNVRYIQAVLEKIINETSKNVRTLCIELRDSLSKDQFDEKLRMIIDVLRAKELRSSAAQDAVSFFVKSLEAWFNAGADDDDEGDDGNNGGNEESDDSNEQ